MTAPRNSIVPQNKNGAALAPFLTRPRVRRTITIILILWLALFLRVWQLDTIPPGLHYDEAFNGTMAREVLRGIHRPIFFTPNFGEEPLHIYTEAILFSVLGESPWTIRFVSVIFGVIFVAAMYACARAFFPRSDLLAIVAAFIAATLYWAINFSRIGIETNGLPMLLTLSAAALAHAFRKMRWEWVLGAGFFMGATVYTYLASRLWLVAIFLWFVYLLAFHRASVRAHFSKWIVMGIVALLTLAPLILFFVLNPVAFSGRSGTVFTPEIFLTNIARTAGMFFFAGDIDPRDNLPGRPALDLFLAIFFGIGFLISLARFRKPLDALLIFWFVVMCLPSALTEFAPNFRRAIGAMPAMILFCAVGAEWIWNRISIFEFQISNFGLKQIARFVIVGVLALSAFWSTRAYFVEWANGTGLFYSFDAGLLQVAKALAARPVAEALYLTPDYDEHYTVIWALDGRALSSFDGRRVTVLSDSSRAATYGIITREDSVTLEKLRGLAPNTQPLLNISDSSNTPYAEIRRMETNFGTGNVQGAIQFGDFAKLTTQFVEFVPQRDTPIQIELAWFVTQAAQENYTVFVQLIGPPNPSSGTPVWDQLDQQPGDGTFATREWRAGQLVIADYTLKLPAHASAGHYQILAGMYELQSGKRVPLAKSDGTRLPNEALVLVEFELE